MSSILALGPDRAYEIPVDVLGNWQASDPRAERGRLTVLRGTQGETYKVPTEHLERYEISRAEATRRLEQFEEEAVLGLRCDQTAPPDPPPFYLWF